MNLIDPSLRARNPGLDRAQARLRDLGVLGRDCEEAVADALEIGYRHIDTAQAYEQRGGGRQGARRGGVPRQELFLTTKLWRDAFHPDKMRASAEGSLARLQVESVDLLLLHWPERRRPARADARRARRPARGRAGQALRRLQLPRSGCCDEALAVAPIFADQVEFHPYLDQRAARRARGREGLHGHRLLPAARGKVPADPVLNEIGGPARQDGGPGGAALAARQAERRHDPEGVEPRAAGRELELFDFQLSGEDRAKIDALPGATASSTRAGRRTGTPRTRASL